VLIILLNNV